MSSFASPRFYAEPRSRAWSIFLGILLLIAGVLAITVPHIAGIAAGLFFGWLVLCAGGLHLIYAWSGHGRAGHVFWQTLIGVAYVIAGLYLLFFPVRSMVALALVLAFYIAVVGVLDIIEFVSLQGLHGAGWLLVDGIVSLVLAGMIFLHWPAGSFWMVGTLVGVSLIFSGISRLSLPLQSGAPLESEFRRAA
jgi:uncharacterized membrane protein HdeD (DUF308 family)